MVCAKDSDAISGMVRREIAGYRGLPPDIAAVSTASTGPFFRRLSRDLCGKKKDKEKIRAQIWPRA